VRHLAAEGGEDPRRAAEGPEVQLRELCHSLLGPLSGSGPSRDDDNGGSNGDGVGGDAAGEAGVSNGAGAAGPGASGGGSGSGWVNEVAGGLKKRALLREVGPARYCPPCFKTHFEPSFLDLICIL
jgi:hypothetical protein